MKRFQFPLDRVLRVKNIQLDSERARLQRLYTERDAIERKRRDLRQATSDEVARRSAQAALPGYELNHWPAWTRATQVEDGRLAAMEADSHRRVQVQRQRCIAAERDCKLLEKLRETRLAEWHYEAGKELENLASDAFLAKWNRED